MTCVVSAGFFEAAALHVLCTDTLLQDVIAVLAICSNHSVATVVLTPCEYQGGPRFREIIHSAVPFAVTPHLKIDNLQAFKVN